MTATTRYTCHSCPLEHALAGKPPNLSQYQYRLTLSDVHAPPLIVCCLLAYAFCSVTNERQIYVDDTAIKSLNIWVYERKGTLGAVKRHCWHLKYDVTVIEMGFKHPAAKQYF